MQQGLDPRPRKVVPSADGSSRYLSEDERIYIADRLLVRASLQSIARDLGRSPSTISREVARTRPDSRRYHPFRAQKMAQKRRPRPRLAKLAGDDELRHYVVDCLSKRWSPQQVCQALRERFPRASNENANGLLRQRIRQVRGSSRGRGFSATFNDRHRSRG
ncbi:transposase [Arthrobacter bambusae]|uniref:transposase n=1 Tax=Arthrobacter bambusae TaxID=1338426 RepID=UPI00352289CB